MEAEKTQLQYLSTSMNNLPICFCTEEDNDYLSQLAATTLASTLLQSRQNDHKLQDNRTNLLAYNAIATLKLHSATSKMTKSTFDEYSREFEYETLTTCKAYPCTESSSLDDCVIVGSCETNYDRANYVGDKSFNKCDGSRTLSHPHTVATRVDKSLLKSQVIEGRLQDKRIDCLASQETTILKAPPTATKATPTSFKVIPTFFKAPPTAINAPPTSNIGVPADDCSSQCEYDLPITCKAHPCTERSTSDSQGLAGLSLSLSQKFVPLDEGGTEDPPPLVCGCGLCQSKHIFTDDMLLLTALWPTDWEKEEMEER